MRLPRVWGGMRIGGDYMRIVDADALKKETGKWLTDPTDSRLLADVIDNAPTIDAVPVVRCKDCRWWAKQEKSIQGRCALNGTYPTGGWYCANGEREEDE